MILLVGIFTETEYYPLKCTINFMIYFFQSAKDLRSGEQAKIEISPGGLEKEERISLSGLSAGKRDVEESSSACSGSLLGNLVS